MAAIVNPPEDTRAYFRGRCLAKYAAEVAAASWDSVIFDVGRESLQRVPTLEPLRGTKAHVGELIDRCDTAAELVDALPPPRPPRNTPRASVRPRIQGGGRWRPRTPAAASSGPRARPRSRADRGRARDRPR